MAIKPLSDRIVAHKQQPITTTKSGILLGEAKDKSTYAIVDAIGPDVKQVKVKDQILYQEYSATEVKIDDKDYLILKESDILATL